MANYIKCIGLAILCFLVGTMIVALIPFFTVVGMGLLAMFIAYCLVQISKMDVDAEIEKLRKKGRSE